MPYRRNLFDFLTEGPLAGLEESMKKGDFKKPAPAMTTAGAAPLMPTAPTPAPAKPTAPTPPTPTTTPTTAQGPLAKMPWEAFDFEKKFQDKFKVETPPPQEHGIIPQAEAGEMTDDEILNSRLTENESALIKKAVESGSNRTQAIDVIRQYRNGKIDEQGNPIKSPLEEAKEKATEPLLPIAEPWFKYNEPTDIKSYVEGLLKPVGNVPVSTYNTFAGIVNILANPVEGMKNLAKGIIQPIDKTIEDYEKQGFVGGTNELLNRAAKFMTEEPVGAILGAKGIKEAPSVIKKLPETIKNLPKTTKGALESSLTRISKEKPSGLLGISGFRKGVTEKGEQFDLPEKSMLDKAKRVLEPSTEKLQKEDALGTSYLSRTANEAVKPGNAGKGWKDLSKRIDTPFQGLKQVWELVRTGKIEGDLSTMVGTSKAIGDAMDKYGKIIGEIRQKATGEPLNTTDIANIGKDLAKTKYKSIQGEAGFSKLKEYVDDFSQGDLSFGETIELNRNLQTLLRNLKKAGEDGTSSYKTLVDMGEALGKKVDEYLAKSDGLKGEDLARYKEAMGVYAKLKGVAVPFLKSTLIDLQRADMGFYEALTLRDFLDPVSGVMKAGQKFGADIIKSRATREGAMNRFFDGLDRIAEEGNWKQKPTKPTK